MPCVIGACGRKTHGWGPDGEVCAMHYRRWAPATAPAVCQVPGCDRPHHSRGMCHAHRDRMDDYGEVLADVEVAETCDGRTVCICDHPDPDSWDQCNNKGCKLPYLPHLPRYWECRAAWREHFGIDAVAVAS